MIGARLLLIYVVFPLVGILVGADWLGDLTGSGLFAVAIASVVGALVMVWGTKRLVEEYWRIHG